MPPNVESNEDVTMGGKLKETVIKEEDHVVKKI